MTSDATFIAALDANPDDWAMRLVYADWLEERGECVKANGQRWMAKKKKCPYRRLFDNSAAFWCHNNSRNMESRYRLGDPLLNQLVADGGRKVAQRDQRPYVGYPSRIAAENALAEALHKLQIVA